MLLGGKQLGADVGAVGHQGDIDEHALLRAHGGVEFIHQAIHGRIGLLTVNMPHG